MNDFKIPVNDAIVDFYRHLNAYPRTILSSKFGDGKSYFLQKVKEDPELRSKYEFLTIYPVNYQVVGNKDIFEILKRDILFQLMLHDMISGNVRLTEAEAWSWYVYKKGGSLLLDLMPYIAEIGFEKEDSVKILAALKGLKLFKDIKKKFTKYKAKELQTDDDILDAFIEKSDSQFIYECDVVTRIIQKCVRDFQNRTHKKVILFVEDMDRIDPAHLFRILNVLSAHIDYCYKDFVKPENSLVGNKFEIDNIVLVIDFHNLRSIYRHFYGQHTDFNGYISKFLSGIPFYYSLENQKYKYIIQKIVELTQLDEAFIKNVFTKDTILSRSMRETVLSFNTLQNAIVEPIAHCEGRMVYLNTSFLSLIALMRRLKWTNEEIKDYLIKLRINNQDMFINYVIPFMFLCHDKENHGRNRLVCIAMKDAKPQRIQVSLDIDHGTATSNQRWMRQGDEVEDDFMKYINTMFEYVV